VVQLIVTEISTDNDRGKWSQLTPLKKIKKQNMQKEHFSIFMLYFESNQGRQV